MISIAAILATGRFNLPLYFFVICGFIDYHIVAAIMEGLK